MEEYLVIRGAKEHNLKNIDLRLPRNKLIVVTGLSGSGKSSLAFDTIYAEGQRRYVESLSSYARQFLEQLQKPDVEYIEGLSPAIAIEQRTAGGNPRSTVATQTEIYDYLRLLFARIGKINCYQCGQPIERQSSQEIVEKILSLPQDENIQILAPIIRGRKGEYRDVFNQIQKSGFVRCRVDSKIYELPVAPKLDKYKIHHIEVVVDRLSLKPQVKNRLTDSIETALKVGKGIVIVTGKNLKELVFSEQYACTKCGISYAEVEPRIFSFNSPYGACPECNGLGTNPEFDPDLVIPDKNKSINQGAIVPWKKGGRGYILYYRWLLRELSHSLSFDLDTPFKKLSRETQRAILYGCEEHAAGKPFEGIIPHLERLLHQTKSDYLKQEISRFMSTLPCPKCQGARLKKESLSVTVGKKNIWDVVKMSIKEAHQFFQNLLLSPKEKIIARQVFKEIIQRLGFCIDVGLEYLTLDRRSSTLSGGEAQRIRLATQVGSGLVGVLYILDEPSIGLHQRDNAKLLSTLKALRDLGNTLIVVEHDEATIRSSDFVVDLGPGAGRQGGEVIFAGPKDDLLKHPRSLTAKYLRRELKIALPLQKRHWQNKKFLEIKGAREHNLKNINVKFPLGVFIGITGVSGSGKSTLIDEILYRALAQKLYKAKEKPGRHDKIIGTEYIDQVIVVDQSPIGRTPRSNPATYTGVYSHIREIFSKLPEARQRGFKPGRFSFNVKGGRCEACAGDGIKKIEMHFLPDIYVKCDVCKGLRFNQATLEVKYKGKSIADILAMTVAEALDLFGNIPKIKNTLLTLYDVGLDYIALGQPATTLSGGEAQRVKLSEELSKRSSGKTLYILDEPTTGLHFADVDKLLRVLQRLVDKQNTVVVIEHNLEVVKCTDYIIDLGPDGGDKGGKVVACGSPQELLRSKISYTAEALRKVLILLFFIGICGFLGHFNVCAQEVKEEEAFYAIHQVFEEKFYDASLELLERFLKDYPASYRAAEANLLIGQCYFYQGKIEESAAKFKSLCNNPTIAQDAVLYWLAEVEIKENRFIPAQGYYQKIINEFPQSFYLSSAALRIIECLYNLKDYPALKEKAASYLNTYKEASKLPYLYFYQAEADYYLDNLNNAVKLYSEAFAKSKDNRLKALVKLGLGWAQLKLKEYPEAEAAFSEIATLDLEKANQESLVLGKAILSFKTARFNLANGLYEELIQNTEDPAMLLEGYLGKAESLYQLAQYPAALEVYQAVQAKISANTPQEITDRLHSGLGWVYLQNNEFDPAIEAFRKVSKYNDEAAYALAFSYFQKQDYKTSREILEKFQEDFKESSLSAESVYLLGLIYYGLDEFSPALEAFKDVVRLCLYGENTDLVLKAEYQIADIYYRMGREEEAVDKFRILRSKYPQAALADKIIFWLGNYYYRLQNFNLARRYFSSLLQDYPKSSLVGEASIALADIYFQNQDYAQAASYYQKCLEMPSVKDKGRLQFRLAEAKEAQGLAKETVEEYLKVSYLYVQDKPLVVKALLRVASIYEGNDNLEEALNIYQRIKVMDVEEAKYAGERIDWLKTQIKN